MTLARGVDRTDPGRWRARPVGPGTTAHSSPSRQAQRRRLRIPGSIHCALTLLAGAAGFRSASCRRRDATAIAVNVELRGVVNDSRCRRLFAALSRLVSGGSPNRVASVARAQNGRAPVDYQSSPPLLAGNIRCGARGAIGHPAAARGIAPDLSAGVDDPRCSLTIYRDTHAGAADGLPGPEAAS